MRAAASSSCWPISRPTSNGFSPNVQDILDNFKFRNQLPTLSKADSIGTLINKFLDPEINLSPNPVINSDGSVKHPGIDNHSMGTVFEELVRQFQRGEQRGSRRALDAARRRSS